MSEALPCYSKGKTERFCSENNRKEVRNMQKGQKQDERANGAADGKARVVIGPGLCFYEEESAWPGVKKTAEKVRRDIELVTGVFAEIAIPDGVSALYLEYRGKGAASLRSFRLER